ncbi:aminotransferase class I/II-fold pyridoxal phosphate-dependent enzyme [Saccharibacillus alkalitolerans]|uniref:Aminotransferase class I/II-fold pyridoxal phosphate-dependent enzyme n=1 Tax=Saccharibacillus alkalitolerans TaxID=2705290 RepID=A0ABX0FAY2_9BACL|nr:aminotransferase class I/II-fold pyridoxal phosphate-dependent enzyme [Saccharibacillus alkalitolerans]NGZ78111.1 aminotransferase class I/II-fold pyridoxal phosphate-dependent enzyme [Saccharibacillus alkalitolerans]
MSGWDSDDAPLYAELLRYAARKEASFHVPGHKDGHFYRNREGTMPEGFAEVLKIDATEIEGTDDLHDPEGVIREAQEKAAAFFGAEETFFLVGGSTVGNLALILTVCTEPGDLLIVQRNVHKSVLNGLMLAGARAVFAVPDQEEGSGLAVLPGEQTLEEALERYPQARGVLLTRPNYYGMGRSIAETAKLCHKYGVPLLVDEAHGAHYGLHPAFPASALAEGADGVVQSTHKMLAAMTMGAMLHVQGSLLDRKLLRKRLAMVQSSSPSYPIMASLDLARSVTQHRGAGAWSGALEAAAHIRRELERLPRFGYVRPELPDRAYAEQDPLKISVYDRRRVLSGYALQQRLAAAGCIAEMSDERRTVLALGPGSGMEDAGRLVAALRELQRELDAEDGRPSAHEAGGGESGGVPAASALKVARIPNSALVSEPVPFDLRPAGGSEPVRPEDASGRIAAEMIVPYPPGIPLIYEGERITASAAEQLIRLREAGARFQGAADGTLTTLRVRLAEA